MIGSWFDDMAELVFLLELVPTTTFTFTEGNMKMMVSMLEGDYGA